MINCPDYNSAEYKSLVNKVGKNEARFLWNAYEGKVPIEVANERRQSISDFRREIGIPYQTNESNRPNILNKVKNHNSRYNSSHSVSFERVGESQRLKVNLLFDTTPYSPEGRLKRAEMRSEEGKVFTEPVQEQIQQKEHNLQEHNKVNKAETMEEAKTQILKDFDSYYPQFGDLTLQEREQFIDMMSEGEINTYC